MPALAALRIIRGQCSWAPTRETPNTLNRPVLLDLASVVVVHRRARVVKHTRSRGAGARLQEWPVTAPGLRRAPARCGPNGGFYLALGRSVTREGPSAPG